MAEIPLYDDGQEVPIARPRDEVRISSASVQPHADGRRIKLSFSLTPFQERPNLDVSVLNPAGQEVASFSLIEAMDTEFDFTIHLRGPQPRGEHTLHMVLFYTEGEEPGGARQVVDEHHLSFDPAEEAAA